ncbi:hypothetical protein BTO30_14855 [Domibacillus antri]|uniref:Late control protein n=1 Tax=Domibacillus antri TaxID=1714264 RepID=A0A1Q8Q253_9BACI|nr:contractile injection system protein, VgrG/Pvc8 family [Domibacillus antri]OLN21397.1 hypothetical protein BTO30_14855 [Domibacillus antri]
MLGRRTTLGLRYLNQTIDQYIHPFLKEWVITDNLSGEADSIDIFLENSRKLWQGAWRPEQGAVLVANINLLYWNGDVKIEKKPMGQFEIDEFEIDPTGFRMGAITLPPTSKLRERHHRAWEKTRLETIMEDIAKVNGLKLYYQTDDSPEIEREEQSGETDIEYLKKITEDAGLTLKISRNTIVVIDEAKLEKAVAQRTINAKDVNLKDFSLDESLSKQYRAAKVTYKNPKSKKTIRHTFVPPKAIRAGRTLVINEEVKNTAEAMRLTKKRLRAANKEACTGSFLFAGIRGYYAGMTVNVKGYGKFDGKYIVTKVRYSFSAENGTETYIEVRRCLEGY